MMTRRTHEKYLSKGGSVVWLPGSVLLWHVVSVSLRVPGLVPAEPRPARLLLASLS